MAIFAVIAPAPKAELTAAIEREFADSSFEFAPGQWVVSASGLTTQQIAKKLGADGEVGRMVVFAVSAHWGYHQKSLWEWLAANAE